MGKDQTHLRDISIGQDQWICCADIDGRQSAAMDLDGYIEPMEEFWSLLETECVAGCCGIQAFSFWPENLERASREWPDATLANRLAAMRDAVWQAKTDVFVSERLNQYMDRKALLQLLDHILRHIVARRRPEL